MDKALSNGYSIEGKREGVIREITIHPRLYEHEPPFVTGTSSRSLEEALLRAAENYKRWMLGQKQIEYVEDDSTAETNRKIERSLAILDMTLLNGAMIELTITKDGIKSKMRGIKMGKFVATRVGFGNTILESIKKPYKNRCRLRNKPKKKKCMKKKIVLTEAELDKKFLPNVISVIKAGNTIGMQCQNGNWLVSFYFFDKGMPLRTMSHPVSINILVALNKSCASFEGKPSGFQQNGFQEDLNSLTESIAPIKKYLKNGEKLWLEKDPQYNYLFKVEIENGKFSSGNVIKSLHDATAFLKKISMHT